MNTRRDNVAVVGVRQGVANASPAAPALGANEVPLYQVRVDAGVTAIVANKVTDVRRQMKSLAERARSPRYVGGEPGNSKPE